MICLVVCWMRSFAALRMTARQDLPRRSGDDNVNRGEASSGDAASAAQIFAGMVTAALRRRC
jgi:hypothetical protein